MVDAAKQVARLPRGGVLTRKIDGKAVASAKDDSFRSFSRLYLRGNQSQLIDSIVLTEL